MNSQPLSFVPASEFKQRAAEAVAIWKQMLADAPSDAPWLPLVRQALQQSEKSGARTDTNTTAGPDEDDVKAAANMSADERAKMIETMVARLAQRLKEKPGDVEGWIRLVRSYQVMGDNDKAQTALKDARAALVDNAEGLTKLNAAAAQLGL